MTATERANAMIQDILENHLPRIKEGLEAGYVDENQILIVYDHAVRARLLKEVGQGGFPLDVEGTLTTLIGHRDDPGPKGPEGKPGIEPNLNPFYAQVEPTKKHNVVVVGASNFQGGLSPTVLQAIRGQNQDAVVLDEANFRFEHPMEKEQNREAMFGKPHVEKLACVCGGIIHDKPTSIENLIECEQCKRVFMDEFELAEARRKEFSTPLKMPDAVYFTNGTRTGDKHVALETEINLNGQKTTVKKGADGEFALTYEQIVRMAYNQTLKAQGLSPSVAPDADLPAMTVTFRTRSPHSSGVGAGFLHKGQNIKVYTGMVINAVSTVDA